MERRSQASAVKALQEIPGVGPAIAEDLYGLGINSVAGLRGRSPQRLYDRLCRQTGAPVDRCMLYVLRCAVFYASHTRHDPARLQWWHWKD
ncbi:MAG: helix-hairpin-helix domain-containing protein [Candidatus Omnitrophota bacterium]|nr:helix-hairpin-helix domain-containing protein [Candidatus Omnitrophota bacterium]